MASPLGPGRQHRVPAAREVGSAATVVDVEDALEEARAIAGCLVTSSARERG